jgi:hypothetical protein
VKCKSYLVRHVEWWKLRSHPAQHAAILQDYTWSRYEKGKSSGDCIDLVVDNTSSLLLSYPPPLAPRTSAHETSRSSSVYLPHRFSNLHVFWLTIFLQSMEVSLSILSAKASNFLSLPIPLSRSLRLRLSPCSFLHSSMRCARVGWEVDVRSGDGWMG